ncbi:lipopolysaccharide biosynthesis protein [Thioalkalivibrio sp. XN279]|uniref:lipopolysaccharide biosynthesis protein n=1 Tax=Thioalkalivibrio sp. XN279 TaxID=2714953 RepID=UPI0014092D35|nr:oligosaccharide flippase family protein [Thioalkalivibrio sp. XN279]NHA15455.1 oligosaccharide flippase family protein [Thioalkalivibrio sp. XN279]
MDPAIRKRCAGRDLSLLYGSKFGALLVGLLVLPAFSRILGPDTFGIVAVVLSVQALMLMLDLGVSIIVGRDIAAAPDGDATAIRILQTGTRIIVALYAALLPIALAVGMVSGAWLSITDVVASMLMFAALTAQNVGQSALLARRHFGTASALQFFGAILRAVITLAALHLITPSLSVFLWTQAGCAIVHWFVTYVRSFRLIGVDVLPNASAARSKVTVAHFLRQGRSLMLFGLAGAAVMNLDKVILAGLASPAAVTPYFLAMSLCMAPVTAFAGPVVQFFQPRIVRSIATANPSDAAVTLRQFVNVISVVTLFPTAALWLFREPITSAWLGDTGVAAPVATYVGVLLPGLACGALGYVPYCILVARKDYTFQASMSAALTIVTLIAAAAVVGAGSVIALCVVYAVYHTVSTLVSWMRCFRLFDGGELRFVRAAAARSAFIFSGFALVTAALALWI